MTEPHNCRAHYPLNRPAPQGTARQCRTCGAWWQYAPLPTLPVPAALRRFFRPPPDPAPQWQRLRWWAR